MTNAIRCRQIREVDLPNVALLFDQGFPDRGLTYWQKGLGRIEARDYPQDYPRFGFMLERNGAPAGALLTIHSECEAEGKRYIRCNFSSWYVIPELSGYASLLVATATRRAEVTYLNISPAIHTRRTIEAQGFRPLCSGLFLTAALVCAPYAGVSVESFDESHSLSRHLTEFEFKVMKDHVDQGYIGFVCVTNDEVVPFLFAQSNRFNGRVKCLHLSYCRSIGQFKKFAGPLGRAAFPWARVLSLDANESLRGLPGKYIARTTKFFKGPIAPRLGDVTYVEDVFFHETSSQVSTEIVRG